MVKKIKILYVDDEPINLQLFEINFFENFEVLTAGSGLAGLSILENDPEIIVVVSDLKMPHMDGLEFIKKAKAIYQDVKYCILTGFALSKDIKEALDSGLINKYMNKPFDVSEVSSTIREVASVR